MDIQKKADSLQKQLDRKIIEMNSMQEIGQALSRELKLERLLTLVIEKVNKLMDAERGTFYIVDAEKGELWSKVAQKAEVKEIRLKIGVGIAGHVAKTGETINIPDAYNDHRFNPEIDKKTGFRTRTILCMPIFEAKSDDKSQPNIIGVLQILNKNNGIFEQTDEELLASIASQIAIALNNSVLYSRLEKKVNELNLIFDIEKDLNKAYDLDELLNILINKITDALHVQAALITVRDPKTNEYTKRVLKNINHEKISGLKFSGTSGIIGEVVKSGQLYFTNNTQNDDLFSPAFGDKIGLKIKQIACVPLIIEKKVIGILELFNKTDPNDYFTQDDMNILNSMAGQISRTIETYRLRDEKIKADRLSAIGNMMSTIVHDLRTPMNNIYGFVDLLKEEDDQEIRNEFADIIIKQIRFLTNMTTDVLDFSKGKSSILPVKCAVDKLISDFVKFFENDIIKRGYKLIHSCDVAAMIYVDPEKINRIFMNIMKNALEAMKKGGTFSITAEKDGENILFKLSDNGPGIPPEIKDTLFDSFVTSGKKGGTGLGLAIVKKLIEEQKGAISVESEKGVGTTFKISFPQLN